VCVCVHVCMCGFASCCFSPTTIGMRNRNNNEGRRGSGENKRDFVLDGNNALYKYADFTRRRLGGG